MNIKISARLLNDEEKKEFGVFVSHSNDNDLFKEVCSELQKADIPHLVDMQIAIASLNFADEIKKLIDKCHCAVVVVTKGALQSSWVNFEVGMLYGEGKNVYLYDPDNLLEGQEYPHLNKFSVFNDINILISKLKNTGYFADLFCYETAKFSKRFFKERVQNLTCPVKLTVTIPNLSSINIENYYFTALVSNFGSYCGKYGEDGVCFQMMDEEKFCPVSGKNCALNEVPDVENYPECVILNKIVDKALILGDDITFIIPLHKIYGTCFKIFAEVWDSKEADRLFSLLKECDVMPSISKSGDNQRIYLSLPDSNWEGVFRLKDMFSNNFLCPGIIEAE